MSDNKQAFTLSGGGHLSPLTALFFTIQRAAMTYCTRAGLIPEMRIGPDAWTMLSFMDYVVSLWAIALMAYWCVQLTLELFAQACLKTGEGAVGGELSCTQASRPSAPNL